MQDTYGCITLDLKSCPLERPQREKKEKLKMMSQQTLEEVNRLMKLTFNTQRKQVNRAEIYNASWKSGRWFNELGMAVHFKELAGIGLSQGMWI